MTPPVKLGTPPQVGWSGRHLRKNLYIVNDSADYFRTVSDADKEVTQQDVLQKPPPEPTMKRDPRKLYNFKNILMVKKRSVLDANKQVTPQDVLQKPPTEPTVRSDPRKLYITKNILMIEKRSVIDANKQMAMTSKPDTKINMDHHVKRGKALVISKSSGSFLVASSRTVLCSRREAKMNTLKLRSDLFFHRLILHVLNLALHISNLITLHGAAEAITNPDPKMAKFLAMRFRYFTTWVVMLHIFYSGSALALQLYREIKKKINGYPPVPVIIEKPKLTVEGLFRAILWPSSLVVSVFFWSLFNYDRELIFPTFLDDVVGWISNQILHTWITIFIFLEVLFKPRIRPLTVAPNLRAMFMFLVSYLSVFYFTLFTEDIWLYPIFSVAYDSGIVNFLLLHMVLLALFLFSYVALWTVNDHFHKHRLLLQKKTRYIRIRWGSPVGKN